MTVRRRSALTRPTLLLAAVAAALITASVLSFGSPPVDANDSRSQNWLHMAVNMEVRTVDELLVLVDEARAAGATGVLVTDSKTAAPSSERWNERMARLVDEIQARDMEAVVSTVSMGFCGSLLRDNLDLAAAYPVRQQPLMVEGDRLVPVQTATIANPGFENGDGDVAAGWDFQDEPGILTTVDRSVARSGQASFRADAAGDRMSRISGTTSIQPWQQYTLTGWFKAANLSASNLAVILQKVDADGTPGRNLTKQSLSMPRDGGGRDYISNPSDFSTDWTPIRLSFNSQDATELRILLGVYGGRDGSVWWDDLRLEATPTMNWINRNGLNQSLTTADGRSLAIGRDTTPVIDPKLGQSRFEGNFDTYHDVPAIEVNPSAGLSDGDIVHLDGWHTMVTTHGQIGCSWNDPAIFPLMDEAFRRIHRIVDADGYLVNYSEVRTGGFEPYDRQFDTSGQAFANSVGRAIDLADAATGDARLYFWSDMVDPFHNARADYYQVAGNLDGAIEGLDPERVTILNWGAKDRIRQITDDTVGQADPKTAQEKSTEFFAQRGFDQIISGFYDEDVADNRRAWEDVTEDVPNITGSLYASWTKPADFSEITRFGQTWWKPSQQLGASNGDDKGDLQQPTTNEG